MRSVVRIAATILAALAPSRTSPSGIFALIAGTLAQATAASARPVDYSNPRFGTTVTFPGEVFSLPQPQPENGDGMTFLSPDGARLAVWGSFNALEQTPEQLADWEVGHQTPNAELTYRRVAKDWLVLSGFDGDEVFYKRFEFGADGVIHGLLVIYPKALKARYDRLVGPIASSFGGP